MLSIVSPVICSTYWSERSASTARAALQMGCMASVVVTIGPSEVRAPAVGVAHAGGERSGLYWSERVHAPAVGVAHAGGERSVHY
jgi:hypothetical protein